MPYVPQHISQASVSKNDSHTGNILSSTYLNNQAAKGSTYLKDQATNNGVDLVAIERHNRYKFGVKKPANRWKHEMDDSRITGAQLRLKDYKGTIFDQDGENEVRPAGIPLKR